MTWVTTGSEGGRIICDGENMASVPRSSSKYRDRCLNSSQSKCVRMSKWNSWPRWGCCQFPPPCCCVLDVKMISCKARGDKVSRRKLKWTMLLCRPRCSGSFGFWPNVSRKFLVHSVYFNSPSCEAAPQNTEVWGGNFLWDNSCTVLPSDSLGTFSLPGRKMNDI